MATEKSGRSESSVDVTIPVPKNALVLGTMVMCKFIDEEGEIHYTHGGDGAMSLIEQLGMSTWLVQIIKDRMARSARR